MYSYKTRPRLYCRLIIFLFQKQKIQVYKRYPEAYVYKFFPLFILLSINVLFIISWYIFPANLAIPILPQLIALP